ncbi:MAG TPA: head-tail connector protein [Clostridia bacterium]|nr:head-tail connector protein [Clostridia bacterium]
MVVTVEEFKAHLRIQYDDEDTYLESLIRQAQAAAEDFCRIAFDDIAPEPVRLAVLLMASHYYENRDNPDKQVYLAMRLAFENLLYPYRDVSQMF